MNSFLFLWVHILDRRETGREKYSWKRHMLEDGLRDAYTHCGARLTPGSLGTCFFITVRKCLISVCHLRHFLSLATQKLRGGRATLPDRGAESTAWLTHRLLRHETQQQRRWEEPAVKGRRTVHDPEIGKTIILSMMIKKGFPAKVQLYCVMLILGNKR